MRRQRIVRLKHPPGITITLSENELDELIECIANVADRAESAAYNMTGTPKGQGPRAGEGQAPIRARDAAGRCANKSQQLGYPNLSYWRTTASLWRSSPRTPRPFRGFLGAGGQQSLSRR